MTVDSLEIVVITSRLLNKIGENHGIKDLELLVFWDTFNCLEYFERKIRKMSCFDEKTILKNMLKLETSIWLLRLQLHLKKTWCQYKHRDVLVRSLEHATCTAIGKKINQ